MGISSLISKRGCPIATTDREWIEYNFKWLIENYSLKELRNNNVVYINENHFPNLHNDDGISIDGCLFDITKTLKISSDAITVEVNNRIATNSKLEISEIDHQYNFRILLRENCLKDVNKTVTAICTEATKVKLIESDIPVHKEEDSELFIFLAMTYFGFGIIAHHYYRDLQNDGNELISSDLQAYILAIFYWLRSEKDVEMERHIELKTRSYFKRSVKFLYSKNSFISIAKLEQLDKSSEQLKSAWGFYNEGHLDLALSLAKEVHQSNKDNPFVIDSLSQFYMRKKEYEEAIPLLENAIELDNNFSSAYSNLGFILIIQEKYSKGLRMIKKAISTDKSNSYAYRNLGYYHTQKKEFDEAFKAFNKAVKINPHTELLHYYMGQAMLANKNKDGAIREFEKSSDRGEPEGAQMLNEIQGYSWG